MSSYHNNTILTDEKLLFKHTLETLCFDLNISFDNLPGDTKDDKARELIKYCMRHGRIQELLIKCTELRPHINWPESQITGTISRSDQSGQSESNNSEHEENLNYEPRSLKDRIQNNVKFLFFLLALFSLVIILGSSTNSVLKT